MLLHTHTQGDMPPILSITIAQNWLVPPNIERIKLLRIVSMLVKVIQAEGYWHTKSPAPHMTNNWQLEM